jgi:hypothetical protein
MLTKSTRYSLYDVIQRQTTNLNAKIFEVIWVTLSILKRNVVKFYMGIL